MMCVKKILQLFFSILFLILSACASKPKDPQDPYEGVNRFIFAVNMDFDHLIMRPVATVYRTVTPPPLQKGVTNIWDNIGLVTTIPNDLLQFKIHYALLDTWRLIINTVFGIGGLFDVATRWGLPKHYEDFGMTLAYYSQDKRSPYLVLPFFGSYTYRDGFGAIFDYVLSPWPYVARDWVSYGAYGILAVNRRAQYMDLNKVLDTSFDQYAFMRNAYFQRRQNLIANNEHDYRPGDKMRLLQSNVATPSSTKSEVKNVATTIEDKVGGVPSSAATDADLDYDFSINK